MFESLDDLESFVRSAKYKETKRDILLFNADLKMKKTTEDVWNLKREIEEYFEDLKNTDTRMYIVFALNKKLLEDEINYKLTGRRSF